MDAEVANAEESWSRVSRNESGGVTEPADAWLLSPPTRATAMSVMTAICGVRGPGALIALRALIWTGEFGTVIRTRAAV
jgi:hypothetical protein